MKFSNIIILAIVVVLFILCFRFIISYLVIGLAILILCAILGHFVSVNTFRYYAKRPVYTISAWPLVVIDLIKSHI